jgi:hypothetical protein
MTRLLAAAAIALLSTTASAEPVSLLCSGSEQWWANGKIEKTETRNNVLITVDVARKTIVADGNFNSSNLQPSPYESDGPESLAFSADDAVFRIGGRLDRATGHLTYDVSVRKLLEKHLNAPINGKTAEQLVAERWAATLETFNGYCRRLERVL